MTISISGLAHIAVKTARPVETAGFYRDVLGFEDAPRPPFKFPGFWMRPRTSSQEAIFHFISIDEDPNGLNGTGAVDHIALGAAGFQTMKERLSHFGLAFRERAVPDMALWQIFVYDPNGILIELNFHAGLEAESEAVLDPDNGPGKGGLTFDPSVYDQFSGGSRKD
ncbi:MAG: glyoxalase [Pseudomonadota bacterium]